MIKLIACDMDGTLLDSQKRLPPELPEVIAQLREKGVIFCVASGRQYASLRRDFEAYADDLLSSVKTARWACSAISVCSSTPWTQASSRGS